MNDRMRRRIERSRARCDKAATSHKPVKAQEAKEKSNEGATTALQQTTGR
jgi:hypothetical protein